MVPGSPLVLERSVRHLVADDRVECTVLPAMSFLDVVYARLGIDPVEVGLRLVDGHEFAVAAAGERGPLLVAHTHANWVLSDIKLAVDDASRRRGGGDPPAPRHARRGDHAHDLGRARPRGRGRPPHVALHPSVGHARRRRVRALPPARPHAARAVPVGHRADPPVAPPLPHRGDLRGRRRDRGPRRRRPDHRRASHRGARRPAVPDRVPRHDRRTAGPVHDRRRRARRARQARATPSARVR